MEIARKVEGISVILQVILIDDEITHHTSTLPLAEHINRYHLRTVLMSRPLPMPVLITNEIFTRHLLVNPHFRHES